MANTLLSASDSECSTSNGALVIMNLAIAMGNFSTSNSPDLVLALGKFSNEF